MPKLGRVDTVIPRYADAPLAAQVPDKETPSEPKIRIGYKNCVVLNPVARTNRSKSWCDPLFISTPVGVICDIEDVSSETLGCSRDG